MEVYLKNGRLEKKGRFIPETLTIKGEEHLFIVDSCQGRYHFKVTDKEIEELNALFDTGKQPEVILKGKPHRTLEIRQEVINRVVEDDLIRCLQSKKEPAVLFDLSLKV